MTRDPGWLVAFAVIDVMKRRRVELSKCSGVCWRQVQILSFTANLINGC